MSVSQALIKQRFVDEGDRLDRFVRRNESQIGDTFIVAVRNMQQQQTLAELALTLQSGNIELALTASLAAFATVPDSANNVLIASGNDSANVVARRVAPMSFDVANPRAVAIMQQNRLRLVREFTEQQRQAVRESIIDGLTRGINPREQARNFRGAIGLTRRQVQAVNNFRSLLEQNSTQALRRALRDRRFDPSIQRAIRTQEPLDAQQIERMVDRYRERFVAFRAETIARTEALRAANQGSHELYQQAVDNGTLAVDQLVRRWITARDERVRASHVLMNGQQRGLNEPFLSGDGNLLLFPGDPSAPASDTIDCRCALTTVLA